MVRVVFDTVVFVRCLINPYSHWGKLVFDYSGRYQLFVSREIVEEILEVLRRVELTAKFASLKNLDVNKVIDLLGQASSVETVEIPSISRDRKDDKFLATAVAANAHYIVTEDEDLVDLEEYQGVKIVNAKTFIELLGSE